MTHCHKSSLLMKNAIFIDILIRSLFRLTKPSHARFLITNQPDSLSHSLLGAAPSSFSHTRMAKEFHNTFLFLIILFV